MLYSECEQKFGLNQTSTNQHLNILPNADYLATAGMSLSPKYNTAFSVTNLLNPVLEDSYKKSQFQQQEASNFLNSYTNRVSHLATDSSGNSTSNSHSSSSSTSSTTSVQSNANPKHPSPSNSAHSHPSIYQNSPTSHTSDPAASYFNYSNSHQFGSFHASGNGYQIGSAAQHHYNLPSSAYNQAYANGTNVNQNFHDGDAYANQQLQYPSGGPQTWYSNPNDPRFSSRFLPV